MIRNLVARFTLTSLAAAACGPSSQSAAPDAPASTTALKEARTRAQDLANSTQNYQVVRFVSDIEQVTRKPAVPKKREEAVTPEDVAVVSDSTPMSAAIEETVSSVSATEELSTPRVPSVIAREAPLPPAVETRGDGWRGSDPGPDMGTVIGVVLRGGRVDPGHCPRHPRPPSQIPSIIPR